MRYDTSTIGMYLYIGANNGPPMFTDSMDLVGRWSHIVATWDGSTVSYYLNGNLERSAAFAGTIVSENSPVFIGCDSGRQANNRETCLSYEGFKGTMDEVGVWDRVLTPDEVLALFRGQLVDEDGKGDACDPCPSTTDASCLPTTCLDEDGDGYGVPGSSACSAGHPEMFDCNDHDPSVHPGAVEACDQVDNNCNGQVDDACIGAPKVTKYHYNAFNQLVKSGVSIACAANDRDCDGIADSKDNCPNVYNPGQEDSDLGKVTPLAADAVAVWGFDEAAGTVAKDAKGAYDGTMMSGATRSPGRYGNGLKLDGVDDRVTVGNLALPASAFTIELWANIANVESNPTVVQAGNGQILFDVLNGKLRVAPPSSQYGTVPSNQWVHLGATWNGTTVRYYVNGDEVGSAAQTYGTPTPGLAMGARYAGSSPMAGTLDDVAIFARALSASEMKTHSQKRLLGDGIGDACDPCVGNADAACVPTTCTDEDGDGYGVQGASNCSAGHPELFDCNDHNANVHPGAVEVPWDGADNDCNGYADEPMTEAKVYQWDGNGNLVSDGATTYTWDARDRLVSGGYGYDTGSLRVKMGTQTVLLDGIEEAREYGAEVKRYDHDPSRVDGLLAQKTGAGKGYFVADALGSVYAVVDGSGAVVSKYGYDVYGARTATSEGMATGWGFTGRRHDSGTAMYYRARYLETTNGIFSQNDPAGFIDGPNVEGVRKTV